MRSATASRLRPGDGVRLKEHSMESLLVSMICKDPSKSQRCRQRSLSGWKFPPYLLVVPEESGAVWLSYRRFREPEPKKFVVGIRDAHGTLRYLTNNHGLSKSLNVARRFACHMSASEKRHDLSKNFEIGNIVMVMRIKAKP